MRRSGPGSLLLVAALACLLGVAACWPYGFAGGGFPTNIRTVAVLPFDNQTTSSDVQREVLDALRRGVESRLGLREAAEARADAVVRGTIQRYETDVPVGYSADPRQATSARRMLQLTVDIEIVDQGTGKPLWQRRGLTAQGEYEEGAEADGRRLAIQRLVNEVIEGAQSQW